MQDLNKYFLDNPDRFETHKKTINSILHEQGELSSKISSDHNRMNSFFERVFSKSEIKQEILNLFKKANEQEFKLFLKQNVDRLNDIEQQIKMTDDPKKLREKAEYDPQILITLMQNEFYFQTTNGDDTQLNELAQEAIEKFVNERFSGQKPSHVTGALGNQILQLNAHYQDFDNFIKDYPEIYNKIKKVNTDNTKKLSKKLCKEK